MLLLYLMRVCAPVCMCLQVCACVCLGCRLFIIKKNFSSILIMLIGLLLSYKLSQFTIKHCRMNQL